MGCGDGSLARSVKRTKARLGHPPDQPDLRVAPADAETAARRTERRLRRPSSHHRPRRLVTAGVFPSSRGQVCPGPGDALGGGQAADFADQGASIAATLPLAITILVIVTLLVLWLMTGSVILPVMALLTNVCRSNIRLRG